MVPIKEYVFVQKDGQKISCIKIVEGEFKDVIYTYGHVKFADKEDKKGKLPLKFDYTIQRNPSNVDTESEEFRNKIGDILIEVVEEQLEYDTIKFK